MALQNKILQLSCRGVSGEVLNKRFASNSRALLKSATSESLRICATGQETFPEDLITPGASAEVVAKETRIKSLKEMPGPSAVSNLIEFFYRDGFSRIHEIQVGYLGLLFLD
uniref:cytochrome P450 27C1-like n=1 Tax=Oncorhynchus gorbuscha TaxID=8017 RepID=UPI001EAEE1F7|nr:cytochrome P450 27C1-like [Oncorhynchus gorbuscha]